MPTYSYRCTECATAFDIQQAFTDDSLTVCPTCGGRLRKLFSAVGVSFTGSGFYRNDSRASENKAREKKEGAKQDAVPVSASKETAAAPASGSAAPASAPSSAPSSAPASAPAKTAATKDGAA
jgi:putative FmdB family regulatory protein